MVDDSPSLIDNSEPTNTNPPQQNLKLESNPEPNSELISALTSKIERIEKERDKERELARLSRLDTTLLSKFSELNILQPQAFLDIFLRRNNPDSLKETSNGWLTKDGRGIDDLVNELIDSDVGKLFLPPSPSKGSGIRIPEQPLQNNSSVNSRPDYGKLLQAAYSSRYSTN
jgi:hypothetical protein